MAKGKKKTRKINNKQSGSDALTRTVIISQTQSNASRVAGISSNHIEKRPMPDLSALIHNRNQFSPSRSMDDAIRENFSKELLYPASKRLEKACRLMKQAEDRLLNSSERKNILQNYDDCTASIPIGELIDWDDYLKCCADIIQAYTLTDFRVPTQPSLVQNWPIPSCLTHCTKLVPLTNITSDEDEKVVVNLVNLGAKEFVVLLATSAMIYNAVNENQHLTILNVVHELHAHAEIHGGEFLDWSKLKSVLLPSSDDYLDIEFWRFALASLGIKITRKLYRGPGAARRPLFAKVKLSTALLLDNIEVFAREQIKLKPTCAVGFSNMGWIAQQSCSTRYDVDGLEAAANAIWWYTKAYEIADKEDNDYVSAAARIEAAGAIVLGGLGAVGLRKWGAVVRRDYRTSFARELNENVSKISSQPIEIICCADHQQGKMLIELEERRLADKNVRKTLIGDGEALLVEWWKVLKLWNEAMIGPYDRLEKELKHGFMVYGETSCWDLIVQALSYWVEEQKLAFETMQFAKVEDEGGYPTDRDRGALYRCCNNCNKDNSTMKCGRCKKVVYCSKACQKEDWKLHKVHCVAVL